MGRQSDSAGWSQTGAVREVPLTAPEVWGLQMGRSRDGSYRGFRSTQESSKP